MPMPTGRGRLGALALATAVFVASGSGMAATCETPPRPAVTIAVEVDPVKFDTSRTVAELGQMDIATKSPYPSHYHTTIGGAMHGEIMLDHRIVYNRVEGDGHACSRISDVKIRLSMRPTVFIAREYTAADQECWFRQIFEHEEKHVDVDRRIIAEYKDRIADGMNMLLLEPADYAGGSVPAGQIERTEFDLKQGIDAGLRVLFDDMMTERAQRQQAIDTEDEYARIARACQVSS